MKKQFIFIVFFVCAFNVSAQRWHLEVGGSIEFRDVLYDQPNWIDSSKFTEIHCLGVNGFVKASKRKFATQLTFGFSKAIDQFIRFDNDRTHAEYFNLNTISLALAESFYLVKKAAYKLDIQGGVVNNFHLNRSIFLPSKQKVTLYIPVLRTGMNFTYHSLIVGVHYDFPMRHLMLNHPSTAMFGASLGVIY